LEKVKISNYNKFKLLIFIQKIEEPLSTRLSACPETSYILRGFKKLVIAFFPIKNTHKLINQQLKNGVKIVYW